MSLCTDRLGLKVASALLLHHGEVSVSDIRSLPFFVSPEEPESVIRAILSNYNVELYTRKVSSEPIPEWEQVIRLMT